MAAAAAAIMAKGKADDKLSSAELLSLIKWKLGKAGGSSKFGRKGARFTAWVGQFKDAPVPDDDYDVVDLPYEAELVELEALLARPAAAPASAPAAAAAPDAAPATAPAAPVVAAVDAEHATAEPWRRTWPCSRRSSCACGGRSSTRPRRTWRARQRGTLRQLRRRWRSGSGGARSWGSP